MKAAWKNRNLQLYFSGQVISLVGTWMQQMALSWLVYKLTNSTFMLGVIGFTSQAPSLFLTPFAGIVADRTNRHRLVLTTQVLFMMQAAILTALVWTNHAQLWQLIVLSAFLGSITAFDLPARQTFLVDMLDDDEQLTSAMSINSSINTLTRLVGPFFAGLFVTWAGEGMCFFTNALSYIAVITALLFVKANQPAAPATKKNSLAQLKEGFHYTMGFKPIRDLIVMLALIGFFAMPFAVLLPAFARDVFHGNASTLGYLNGAAGAGSLLGALFLSSRKGIKNLSRWIIIGCVMYGAGLVIFGFSHFLPLSLLAVAGVGFSSMSVLAGGNTVIQTIVDKDKRGRVMSFVIMAFLGFSPFGAMAAGALANSIGVGATVAATGIITVAIGLIFSSRIMNIHLNVKPAEIKEGIAAEEAEMSVVGK
jgi:MFS family permease